jgi:hypothetical protein
MEYWSTEGIGISDCGMRNCEKRSYLFKIPNSHFPIPTSLSITPSLRYSREGEAPNHRSIIIAVSSQSGNFGHFKQSAHIL